MGHHAGGVGGQAVALVTPLRPHADLVERELLQVGEDEGGGGGGGGVEGAVLRVVLVSEVFVHRHRVHRAQKPGKYSSHKNKKKTLCLYTAKTVYRKFKTKVPRNETAWPQSQFLYTHVGASDLYIPTIRLPIFCCRKIGGPNVGIYK